GPAIRSGSGEDGRGCPGDYRVPIQPPRRRGRRARRLLLFGKHRQFLPAGQRLAAGGRAVPRITASQDPKPRRPVMRGGGRRGGGSGARRKNGEEASGWGTEPQVWESQSSRSAG